MAAFDPGSERNKVTTFPATHDAILRNITKIIRMTIVDLMSSKAGLAAELVDVAVTLDPGLVPAVVEV